MTQTITASDLVLGDHIVGDRTYQSGVLDMRVIGLEAKVDGKMIVVKALAGPYDILRSIAYSATDKVIVTAR